MFWSVQFWSLSQLRLSNWFQTTQMPPFTAMAPMHLSELHPWVSIVWGHNLSIICPFFMMWGQTRCRSHVLSFQSKEAIKACSAPGSCMYACKQISDLKRILDWLQTLKMYSSRYIESWQLQCRLNGQSLAGLKREAEEAEPSPGYATMSMLSSFKRRKSRRELHLPDEGPGGGAMEGPPLLHRGHHSSHGGMEYFAYVYAHMISSPNSELWMLQQSDGIQGVLV